MSCSANPAPRELGSHVGSSRGAGHADSWSPRALVRWGLVFRLTCVAMAVCMLASAAVTKSTSSSAAKKKTAVRPVHSAARAPAKTAPKSTAKAGTTAAKPGTTAARSRSSKTVARTKRPIRSTQQTPTPDRYKEIQAALIDKGYLQGEATGEWGPDSVDALKRFQADQNLDVDGKIGALSLIALGLGPKRLTAQTPPAAQTPATQAPAQQIPPPPPPPAQPADPSTNVAK